MECKSRWTKRLPITIILMIYNAMGRTWTARSRKFWWTAAPTRWSRTSRTRRAPSITVDRAATLRWENNNFGLELRRRCLVLRSSCAFAGGQRDHQVPSRWPDPTSGEQAVRVSVFFLHFLAQFFCYSQLFPGRKDSCFLGLFCLTPWDVSQTEPECNRTSKYLFLEVGRKYIHPLKIATEIDCHDSCLLPLGSSGLDFFVLKRLTLYRL